MTCKEIKTQLQDLLDETLKSQDARKVQNHLKICASCQKEYRQLQMLSQVLASFPYYSPSQNFNSKVLAALELDSKMAPLPWANYSIAALGTLVVCWMASLCFLFLSKLSFWKVLAAIQLFMNPSTISARIKLYLAKSVLILGDLLAAADTLGRWIRFPSMNLWLQLAVATLMAGCFLAFISRNAPINATARKWRTL